MLLRRIAWLLLAPYALSAQVVVDGANETRIELADAVRLAQQNSPLAEQAQGSLRIARAALNASYFAFLPNVTASASSSWQKGQRIGPQGNLIDFTGPRKSFNDALSFNIELFDGGRRFLDIKLARAELDAADASELAARYVIALDVKEQYFTVIAAREAEAAARAQLSEAQQQLAASTVRLHAGAAIRSDSLRSVVLVGNATLALTSAQTALANASAALTRLVGSQEPVTAGSVPADELLPVENADALFATLGQAPDMLAAQSTLQSARASMRTARSTFLPTLSATYGRNGSGFDSGYGFRDPFAYASSFRLNFSLPIFNQLQREQTAIRAAVAEDAAEANLRDTGLRLREELTAAVGLLSNAQQRVSVQEASVRAAEEDLSIQQQRYDLNAALLLDVMQSQSALNQARAGLISARRDWRVARARIEALLGRELGSE